MIPSRVNEGRGSLYPAGPRLIEIAGTTETGFKRTTGRYISVRSCRGEAVFADESRSTAIWAILEKPNPWRNGWGFTWCVDGVTRGPCP